ncbi:MAG: hypothetical protein IJ607_04845 [Bacteroidaceae bacterium]|nr:hypothetical protein [Bacteroidaceae bacterium]
MLRILTGLIALGLMMSCACGTDEAVEDSDGNIRTNGMLLRIPAKEVLVGTIGVCTSSDNLELIKPDSGIVNIKIGNERFFGSSNPGDSVEVTLLMVDGHPYSSTIVNLNSLLQTWEHRSDTTSVNTFLAIQENHYAHYFNNVGMDDNCNWYLNDGRIILSTLPDSLGQSRTDTLHILSMNADTLLLYHDRQEVTFMKQTR